MRPGGLGNTFLPLDVLERNYADHHDCFASPGPAGVAWFVQISDLHVSRWMHPDIVPDLIEWGQQVLPGLRPGALLITGDLTDAKSAPGEGSGQQDWEWRVR
jgi:predicted MPP superfamily phosphohydrolase